MRLTKFLSIAACAALTLSLTAKAEAAIYDFSLHSANYDIVGSITTSGDQLTSISGHISGALNATIDGLAYQPNVYYTSDNLFSPTGLGGVGPLVSNQGILFGAGGYFINIYSVLNGSKYDYYVSNSQFVGNYYVDPNSAPLFSPGDLVLSGTIAAVPELSTWVMMIVGFAGVTLAGRRRWIKQSGQARALAA